MPEPPAIQVFIVDDHPVVREGLRMLVGSARDLAIAGEAASAREAASRLGETGADVVLLDVVLGREDGLEELPRLRAAAPRARFLVITGVRGGNREAEALRAGAQGIVSKEASGELILKAIRKVHAGELWFEAAVLAAALHAALEESRRADPNRARIASLTAREREVVALVGQGLRNEEISRRLSIAEKTIRNHVSDACAKLGLPGRLELLVFANRYGLGRLLRGEP
jgi:DNA-binding NarL/FixJ family response regulator